MSPTVSRQDKIRSEQWQKTGSSSTVSVVYRHDVNRFLWWNSYFSRRHWSCSCGLKLDVHLQLQSCIWVTVRTDLKNKNVQLIDSPRQGYVACPRQLCVWQRLLESDVLPVPDSCVYDSTHLLVLYVSGQRAQILQVTETQHNTTQHITLSGLHLAELARVS